MKRKSKFIILLTSMLITIATLYATIGKPFYIKHGCMKQHCAMEHKPSAIRHK